MNGMSQSHGCERVSFSTHTPKTRREPIHGGFAKTSLFSKVSGACVPSIMFLRFGFIWPKYELILINILRLLR
jgi:hypothetical protein